MFHRAVLERNTTATSDRFGLPEEPSWSAQVTLACRAWSKRRTAVRDGGKVVTVQALCAAFPLGADIQEGDRLQSITDRRSTVLFAGPLMVEEIVHKATHQEVQLERP